MNTNDESLYTDEALQLISAFTAKDIDAILLLIDGANDKTYVPGILFGMMVHFELLLSAIAESNEITKMESLQQYAFYYNSIRESLSALDMLKPSSFQEILKNDGGWL